MNSANNVYTRPVDGSGSWASIPGKKMKYISVGLNVIYGIDKDSKIFQCKIPCSGGEEWEEVEFCLPMNQLEVAVGEIIGSTSAGGIYKKAI